MKANCLYFIHIRKTEHMLDYAALNALCAVVREGSFERAARALHVTPSAISQRIRLLEERVGCALVVRGQPCVATETGRRLCQHVDRVQLLEQELQGTLPALAPDGLTRVSLPVAVNADSLATWFAPALAAFAASLRVQLLLIPLGGLFVIITLSVVLQVLYFKATKGKRLFKMAPLHHHFELMGWGEVTVVLRFWIIAGLSVALGLGLFYTQWVAS